MSRHTWLRRFISQDHSIGLSSLALLLSLQCGVLSLEGLEDEALVVLLASLSHHSLYLELPGGWQHFASQAFEDAIPVLGIC